MHVERRQVLIGQIERLENVEQVHQDGPSGRRRAEVERRVAVRARLGRLDPDRVVGQVVQRHLAAGLSDLLDQRVRNRPAVEGVGAVLGELTERVRELGAMDDIDGRLELAVLDIDVRPLFRVDHEEAKGLFDQPTRRRKRYRLSTAAPSPS